MNLSKARLFESIKTILFFLVFGVIVISLLNSKSRYFESEDGSCGILIQNNWAADLGGEPIYSVDLLFWNKSQPDYFSTEIIFDNQQTSKMTGTIRTDSIQEIPFWSWFLMRHFPQKYYAILLSENSTPPNWDKVIVTWASANSEILSTTIKFSN